MAITLEPQEIEAFLKEKKTLVLTILRKDGSPVSIPMWFVYADGHVYMHSLKRGAKVHNVRRDPRVCLAVESGERWADLKAVVIQGRCAVLEGPAEVARFDAAYRQKYAGLTRPDDLLPQRVRDHYAGPWIVLRVTPEKVRTWDNSKIRLAAPAR
mgnify:FL=1